MEHGRASGEDVTPSLNPMARVYSYLGSNTVRSVDLDVDVVGIVWK
jgi:hypothetical protein